MCSMKKRGVTLIFGEEAKLFLQVLTLTLFSRGLFQSQGSLALWTLKNFLPFVRCKRVVHEQSYYLFFSDRLLFGQIYLMSFSASTSLPGAHKFQRFFGDRRCTTPKCWFLLNRTLVTVCYHSKIFNLIKYCCATLFPKCISLQILLLLLLFCYKY